MNGVAGPAGGTAKAAARALAAGNDLLCLGSRVDAELVEESVAEILAGVEAGWLPLSRVEEAAERVAGLAAWTAATRAAQPAEDGIGYPAAQCAVKVEGSLAGLGVPLIVQVLESEAEVNIAVGPGVPAPMTRPSTDETGTTSASVPQKKTSRAVQTSKRPNARSSVRIASSVPTSPNRPST